jgi:hypothetical protein
VYNDFVGKQSLQEKSAILVTTDDRVDGEVFNNLCSKSYFKGLIMLHLINFQHELKSKVKAVLNEMGILLTDSQFKDMVQKLEYGQFSKMETGGEYGDFNSMYAEYQKLRDSKINELRKRQADEEQKRIEREKREGELAEEMKGMNHFVNNYR